MQEQLFLFGITLIAIIFATISDLKTFEIDVRTTLRLAKMVPDSVVLVSESGLRDRFDSVKLRGKADAMLIGTAILRAEDMARKVYEFKLDRSLIKVCGIQDQETATQCEEMGVELLGFNFVEGSPRYVSPDVKIEVKTAKKVALFADAPLEIVNEMASDFDFVQLHGKETAEYCDQVKAPVIKSFLVGEEPYENVIPLFDLKKGEEGVIKMEKEPDVPYFLAGGLSPQNVAEVTARLNPYCVDVARGVECGGKKDVDLIKKFINQLKKC